MNLLSKVMTESVGIRDSTIFLLSFFSIFRLMSLIIFCFYSLALICFPSGYRIIFVLLVLLKGGGFYIVGSRLIKYLKVALYPLVSFFFKKINGSIF